MTRPGQLPHQLRKEQLAALMVLTSKWPDATSLMSQPLDQGVVPVTGFVQFSRERVSPRAAFHSPPWWTWNQSHTKQRTAMREHEVILQKFSPKRLAKRATGAEEPLPKYKVWLMTVLQPVPTYFVWVEKGEPSASGQRRSSLDVSIMAQPSPTFSPWSSPEVTAESGHCSHMIVNVAGSDSDMGLSPSFQPLEASLLPAREQVPVVGRSHGQVSMPDVLSQSFDSVLFAPTAPSAALRGWDRFQADLADSGRSNSAPVLPTIFDAPEIATTATDVSLLDSLTGNWLEDAEMQWLDSL